MGNRFAKSEFRSFAARRYWLLAVVFIMLTPLLGSAQTFTVPDDVALRIRLGGSRLWKSRSSFALGRLGSRG